MKVSTKIFEIGQDLTPLDRVSVDDLRGLSPVEVLDETTRVYRVPQEFQVHPTLHFLVRNKTIEQFLRALLLLNQRVVDHLTGYTNQLISRALDLADVLVVKVRSTSILTSEIFIQFTRQVILHRSKFVGVTHSGDLFDLVLQIVHGYRSMIG